jgi:hypothetical protein
MNGNTSATTRQRKPRPKPARSIRLEIPPEGKSPGVVQITVGTGHTDYFINELPADFGRGFKLMKLGLHATEGDYHVNIDGAKRSCDCKGFLRHGHCKHSDGLAALIAAGRL